VKFGVLRVTTGDGRTREYPLDLPTLVVGRADGNSIVIDDLSVARRHARLTIDSGRLLLEDLGSASGTFIGQQRIDANTPSLVDNNQLIRFGDVEAQYEAPAAVATDQAGGDAETQDDESGTPFELPPTVRATFTLPPIPVEAGGSPLVGTLIVQNRGRVVDELSISVMDLPAEWVRLSTSRLVLVPNDQAEVTLVIQPPRRADARAGEYDFSVIVTSGETSREVLANGHVAVLPFESTTLELHPVRSKRHFTLLAENRGNANATFTLSGTDDEELFLYEFERHTLELAPGEEAQVPFRVSPRKRRFFGPTLAAPFTVVATPASEASAKATAAGQLTLRPMLQPFVAPLLFTIVVAVIAGALFYHFFWPLGGVASANAEAAYVGIHLCDANKTATPKPAPPSAAAPLFEQNDPQWGKDEYANGKNATLGPYSCGSIMAQCGAAITSLATVMNLFQLTVMPDGSDLNPKTLNTWANQQLRAAPPATVRVSQGYDEGDVIWPLVDQLSAEIAKAHPGARLIRFAGIGTGSDAEVRAELQAGRPVILQLPGHWITAVGLDGNNILINDPYYRDRKTLAFYKGKVQSSVLFATSNDLGAIAITVPGNVRVRVTDAEGRVVGTITGATPQDADKSALRQIPGSSYVFKEAMRDPTCVQPAPAPTAGVNQIILPGVKDTYKVEVAAATNGPTTVAIHIYDRNGNLTMQSLDNAGPAVLSINYDPSSPTSQISLVSGTPATPGTSTAAAGTTPAAGGTGTAPGQTGAGTPQPGAPSAGGTATAKPATSGSPGAGGTASPTGTATASPTATPAPPNNVTVTCSPAYSTGPTLATVTCTAAIGGTLTTTNWTVNGVPFPAAQGKTVLTTTFTANTNATIQVSACNLNACTQGTAAVAVVFPPVTPTGTPVPSATPSVTPTPTPSTPPAGPDLTCVVSGPMNQSDVTCSTTFSGTYSAIIWQAPGDDKPVPGAGAKTWTLHTSLVSGTLTIGGIAPTNSVNATNLQASLDTTFGTGAVAAASGSVSGPFTLTFQVSAQICNGNACVAAPTVQVQIPIQF